MVPLESTTANPKQIERTYIPTPDGAIGVLTRTSTGSSTAAETFTSKTDYWHKDHLGSLVATDYGAACKLLQKMSLKSLDIGRLLNLITSSSNSFGGATVAARRLLTERDEPIAITYAEADSATKFADIWRFRRDKRLIRDSITGLDTSIESLDRPNLSVHLVTTTPSGREAWLIAAFFPPIKAFSKG